MTKRKKLIIISIKSYQYVRSIINVKNNWPHDCHSNSRSKYQSMRKSGLVFEWIWVFFLEVCSYACKELLPKCECEWESLSEIFSISCSIWKHVFRKRLVLQHTVNRRLLSCFQAWLCWQIKWMTFLCMWNKITETSKESCLCVWSCGKNIIGHT